MTSTTAMDEIEKKAQAHIDALEAATHWSSTSRRFKDALLAGIAALRAAPAAAGVPEDVQRDAERYRVLRRKVAIVGSDFHIINLHPTYVAPDAAVELDACVDAAQPKGEEVR